MQNKHFEMKLCWVLYKNLVPVANEDVFEAAGPTLGAPVGQEIDEFINVAYNKEATQTSENQGASADKAVDGWTSQDWRG